MDFFNHSSVKNGGLVKPFFKMKNKGTKCFRTTTTTMLSDVEFLLVILWSVLMGYVSTTSLGKYIKLNYLSS